MKYFRNIALAASLASGFALPAMAQMASPDATPAPQVSGPADTAAMPDAGVKKAAPSAVKHTHHAARKVKVTKPGKVKTTEAK